MSQNPVSASTVSDTRPIARRRRLTGGQTGLLIVVSMFVVLYSWLLIASDFLPYVTDNNESFSSLWHAHNLYHFDIRASAGLTDEASSPHPDAHPFVHTHQGNVPRLFAFLLFVLGSRTIESQIALTTLIVGTGTVAIAYRLFWRLVGPLFATVACLVMITDYLFFGQWVVVTYRVWHYVFVFGALLCAYEMRGNRPRRWAAMSVGLFAMTFYYELVFAGFTLVFAGLFAGWQHRWQLKRLLLVWTTQVAGAMIGVGTLAAQLTAHFGADVALEDFYLTFVARNAAASNPALREYMTEFFLSHNIVFWQNVVDVRSLRTFEQFTWLLTTSHIQWYTPLVGLLSGMLLVGWVAGLGGDTLTGWTKRRYPRRDMPGGGPKPLEINATTVQWSVVVMSVLGFGLALLVVTLFASKAFLGLPLAGGSITQGQGVRGWLFIVCLLGAAALAAWNGAANLRSLILAIAGVSPTRVVLTMTVLACAVIAIRGQSVMYEGSDEPLWNGILQQTVPMGMSRAGAAILLGLAAALALAGPKRVLGQARADQLRGIGPYVLCGMVAYATVYMISPGYVLSGYLSRFAPLAVFVLEIPLAVTVYLVVAATMRAIEVIREHRARSFGSRFPVVPVVRAALLTSGLTFLVGFWLQVQVQLFGLLPPTNAAFLKMLGQPPLRGSTLFSNSYIAPMTVYTGEWGYNDTTLALWNVQATDAGYVVERGRGEYIWLRDRLTNPAYAQPDLFVCVRPVSMYSILQRVTGHADKIEGCGTIPLVAKAADGAQQYLRNQIVARDSSEMDAWAIVRLDWDYPPYLEPLSDSAARGYVDVERKQVGDQVVVSVRYEYRQQQGKPESGTRVQLEGVRADGMVCTLMQQTVTPELLLSSDIKGRVRVVVEPSTVSKAGPRFTSDPLTLGPDSAADSCQGKPVRPG